MVLQIIMAEFLNMVPTGGKANSPDTDYGDHSTNAFYVGPYGDVDYDDYWGVMNSYGRSPNCTSDSNACYVISDGVVYYGVGNDVDWYSCGRSSPGIVDTDMAAFFVLSSGKVYDEYLFGGYVKDSYG